jgi:hypothetical protein
MPNTNNKTSTPDGEATTTAGTTPAAIPATPVFAPEDTNKDGKIDTSEVAAAEQKQSAFDIIIHTFDNVGAPELGQWLANAIKGDPTLVGKQNELFSQLQQSDPYKQRFSGLVKIREYNKTNPTNPMPVMSEAEYLSAESSYKQILSPVSSMYGNSLNQAVGDIIAKNISPVELQDRVNVANQWVMAQNPAIKQELQKWYGIDDTHLMQYALDPERGVTEIQKAAGAAQLGAQAIQSAVDLTQQQSESLIKQLVSSGQAKNMEEAGLSAAAKLQDITTGTATAYNPNAGTLKGDVTLSKIEGVNLQASDVLGAALGINEQTASDITGLKSRERARFNQGAGGTNVLQTNVSGNV